ncbi:hypothetical protein CDAR_422741 [Caerostris darwini]|uniref:Uncharacterized protein n=1 Tax=Caerostris darwini TaxID=1538125 RepID=A0AAV4W5V3_9ARAC|nr:hypothetical protein CDAR_422741 [Caerostris darwini]
MSEAVKFNWMEYPKELNKFYFAHVEFIHDKGRKIPYQVVLAHLTNEDEFHTITSNFKDSVQNAVSGCSVLVLEDSEQVEFFKEMCENVIPVQNPLCNSEIRLCDSSKELAWACARHFQIFPWNIDRQASMGELFAEYPMFERYVHNMQYGGDYSI